MIIFKTKTIKNVYCCPHWHEIDNDGDDTRSSWAWFWRFRFTELTKRHFLKNFCAGKVISYKINSPDFKLFSLQQRKSNKATALAKRKSKKAKNSLKNNIGMIFQPAPIDFQSTPCLVQNWQIIMVTLVLVTMWLQNTWDLSWPVVAKFFPGVSFRKTTRKFMYFLSNLRTFCAISCTIGVNLGTFYEKFALSV